MEKNIDFEDAFNFLSDLDRVEADAFRAQAYVDYMLEEAKWERARLREQEGYEFTPAKPTNDEFVWDRVKGQWIKREGI